MNGTSPGQLRVLRFVGRYVRAHQYAPSVYEIMAELGFASTNAVTDHFRALERKGLIQRVHLGNRTLTITPAGWSAMGIHGCPFCQGAAHA